MRCWKKKQSWDCLFYDGLLVDAIFFASFFWVEKELCVRFFYILLRGVQSHRLARQTPCSVRKLTLYFFYVRRMYSVFSDVSPPYSIFCYNPSRPFHRKNILGAFSFCLHNLKVVFCIQVYLNMFFAQYSKICIFFPILKRKLYGPKRHFLDPVYLCFLLPLPLVTPFTIKKTSFHWSKKLVYVL